jgi:hypothetical protein
MSQQNQPPNLAKEPTLKLTNTEDYRDGYANSVQVRMSVWDFFLVFGTMTQQNAEELTVKNFQGIYLTFSATISPNTSRPLALLPSSSSRTPAAPSTKA